jgi:hypothetical protein
LASSAITLANYLDSDQLPEDGDVERREWREIIQNFANVLVKEITRVGQEDAKVIYDSKKTSHLNTILTYIQARPNQTPVSSKQSIKALDFGTPSKLNWDVLVAERERHETEESKSAVTYRYKHAEADGLLDAVSSSLGDNPKTADADTDDGTDASKSKHMKAAVVTEIARVISASITSTAKPNTTGLERRVRWRGLGVLAEDDATGDDAVAAVGNNSTLASSAHSLYTTLERRLPFSFVTAGIHFHPLKHSLWVLVGFRDRVWLGTGKSKFHCTISNSI